MRHKYVYICMMLVLCTFVAAANNLHKGSVGTDVMRLQEALIDSGYLSREADGEFGSTTEKALQLLQRDKGLAVTGVIAVEAIDKLTESAIPREGGGILYAPGNLGDDVVRIQKILIAEGYLDTVPDGIYGTATKIAIEQFQKDNNLEVIGALDEATWEILGAARGESLSRGKVKGVRKAKDAKAKTKKVKGSRESLSVGCSGREVLRLQRLLIQNGYNPGIVDADFGPGTERALCAWQRQMKVAETGVADEFFWNNADVFPAPPKKFLKKWQMEASAYSSQDADTTNRTARGSILSRGHVAVDPNIIPLGSLVYVEGYGYGVADDIGSAIRRHKIDLAMDTRYEALQWGRRTVTVYLVEKP